jgi:hypothetical protein
VVVTVATSTDALDTAHPQLKATNSFTVVVTVPAPPEGEVVFANNHDIFGPDGKTDLSGPNYVAEMYVDVGGSYLPVPDSICPVQAGFFYGPAATEGFVGLDGSTAAGGVKVAPATDFTYEIKVWNTAFGATYEIASTVNNPANLFGSSAPFTESTDDPPPAPPFDGLNFASFSVEPPVVVDTNHPPVLSSISSQTVLEAALLTVTNAATEADPNAVVSYALVGAPAGMTINSKGVITWTPAASQSPGTAVVVTVATSTDALDTAHPQLKATNSFTVVVTVPVPPEGEVVFANNHDIFGPDGKTDLSGPNYVAELYVDVGGSYLPVPDSICPVQAGFFYGPAATEGFVGLDGSTAAGGVKVAPATDFTYEIKVWNTAFGATYEIASTVNNPANLFGSSAPFTESTDDPPPAPPFDGLNFASFSVAPVGGVTIVNPPTITTQPVNETVTAGATSTFTVAAGGSAPLAYQWRLNGANLQNGPETSGAGAAMLKLYKTQSSQAGNYTVVVTNIAGAVTSAVATLTVGAPPAITGNPSSQTVAQGGAASFSATATGTPNLVYHWVFHGTNLLDGGPYSGSGTPTLTISGAQAANAGSYYVLVTNLFGAARSSSGQLTVVTPPTITSQPANATVAGGSTATFAVTANSSAPVGYQWRFNGASLQDGAAITGSAASILKLYKTQLAQTGNYTVVVTNIAGAVTSAVATLTVDVPPAITVNPSSQSVARGGAASFSATATGTPNLVYHWVFHGTNLLDGGPYSGSGTPTLTISGAQAANAGGYYVLVTNLFGAARSSSGQLTVIKPPTITSQPANQTVAGGFEATFGVTANSSVPVGYQWRFNGANLQDGPAITGSAASILRLYKTQFSQTGNYTVVVTNISGAVTSAVATLTVDVAPVVTGNPANQLVPPGGKTSFSAAATGTPNLAYHWVFHGTNLLDGGAYSGSATPTLTVSGAQSANAGAYYVLVTNLFGAARSSSGTLSLVKPPTITTQPANQTVAGGFAATFTVAASSSVPPGYQWRFNGANLSDGPETTGSATPTLKLYKTQFNQTGNYTVVVTNTAGAVTSAVATLTVDVAPVITGNPANQSVAPGGSASFTAAATGTPNLVYHWVFHGTNLLDGGAYSGSATPTLTIAGAQAANSGGYYVVVTNLFGAARSSSGLLSVVRPPTITILSPLANQTLTNASALAAGATSDNGPVTNVFYQLNGGGWQPAQTTNSWTNWTAQLVLAQGINTLQAYALNSVGSPSATAQVAFAYSKPPHPSFRQAASPPEIVIVSAQVADGRIQLELSSSAACSVVVQASEDLVNWAPIASRALPAGESVTVEDTISATARFYRVVPQQ